MLSFSRCGFVHYVVGDNLYVILLLLRAEFELNTSTYAHNVNSLHLRNHPPQPIRGSAKARGVRYQH